ncbi:hypothetical protein D9M71_334300 [compost metagenome]
MVGRCGASRQQQFSQSYGAGQLQFGRGQPRPNRVQGLQPREQRLVDHRCPGTGQGLVEVVMGVDQTRQYHVFTGIENLCTRAGGLLAEAEHFGDHAVFQHQAATGVQAVGSENGQGVF